MNTNKGRWKQTQNKKNVKDSDEEGYESVCFLQISVSRRQLAFLIHAGLPSIPGAASSLNGPRWQGYYCGVGRLLFTVLSFVALVF